MNINNFNTNGGNNDGNNGVNRPIKETLPRSDKMLKFENEYMEDMENFKNFIFWLVQDLEF